MVHKVTLKDIIEKFEAEEKIEEKAERKISFFEMLTPAFIGGIIIGVIAGIPIFNLLLPLICIGGYLAVKFLKEFYELEVNEKEAAKIGVFAGFIGAFLSGLVMLIIASLFVENFFKFFRDILGWEVANFLLLLSGFDVYTSLETLRLRFIANFIFCILFSSIGAWLYSKFTKI